MVIESMAKYILDRRESNIECFGSKRRVYVRRKPKVKLNAECVVATFKYAGGYLMV